MQLVVSYTTRHNNTTLKTSHQSSKLAKFIRTKRMFPFEKCTFEMNYGITIEMELSCKNNKDDLVNTCCTICILVEYNSYSRVSNKRPWSAIYFQKKICYGRTLLEYGRLFFLGTKSLFYRNPLLGIPCIQCVYCDSYVICTLEKVGWSLIRVWSLIFFSVGGMVAY